MYSIQQQYNVVPGQYAKEMAAVTVFPHLKGMARDVAGVVSRAMAVVRGKRTRTI